VSLWCVGVAEVVQRVAVCCRELQRGDMPLGDASVLVMYEADVRLSRGLLLQSVAGCCCRVLQ